MILYAQNETAANGTPIHASVQLDPDDVGHVDRPFRWLVMVAGVTMAQGFDRTRDDARSAAGGMVDAYLEVHAAAETYKEVAPVEP